jgi:type I restriction enzyme S subunit
MSKQEEKSIVPPMRFPDFRGTESWKGGELGQYLLIHPEYGINAPAVPYAKNLPTYLRITDISEGGQIRQNKKVSVAKSVTEKNYLEDGDIVLARTGASVGKSYKYKAGDGRLVFAGFLIRVRPNEEKLSSELLFQYLSTAQYWRWVDFSSTRSGQPGINANEYSSLPIPLPPTVNEQQKIADCLSSIDGLVTAQNQKLETLKTHKKSLMQQLFPAEGEAVPKLRFAEFRGGWNISTIEEIATISSGGTPSRSQSDYWGGEIPWITTTLLSCNTIDYANEFITEAGLRNSSTKLYPKNTILMAMYGQGKTRGQVAKLGFDATINQACAAFTLNERVSTDFVFQNLSAGYDEIREISNEGGQQNLSGALIKGIPFSYPDINTGEQQKIAELLTSIDDLITAQTQKVESLKAHKKGLMQQLFPTVDEVSI